MIQNVPNPHQTPKPRAVLLKTLAGGPLMSHGPQRNESALIKHLETYSNLQSNFMHVESHDHLKVRILF